MSEGKRPGGLTALAVFNFIGSGFDLLGILSLVAGVWFAGVRLDQIEQEEAAEATAAERAAENPGEEQPDHEPTAEDARRTQEKKALEALRDIGWPTIIFMSGMLVVLAVLLITSGIGYLRQLKFVGRTLGNAYAVVSILTSSLEIAFLPDELSGENSIMVVVAFLYPALTLFLLNTTFKEDFVN